MIADRLLRIVALMVGAVFVIGLVTHAAGTAKIIDSITGFFSAGYSAELGNAPKRKGA